MYAVGLRFWNVVTPYYIMMYFLEEIPNFYNFCLCLSTALDSLVPDNITGRKNRMQEVLYYWKPCVMFLSTIVLILDFFPLGFGAYIWYYGDGDKDKSIG